MSRSSIERLDRSLYPHLQAGWDHELLRREILSVIRPGDRVLDLGAGRGLVEHMDFRGIAGRVHGVDVDPVVHSNPLLDESRVIQNGAIPYPDATFDVVYANCVWEHLEHPVAVFREVARVLKPGGVYVGKTPNRWHYVALIAALTPHWFHEWINQRRGLQADDVFPTFYRVNTPRALRRVAADAGFRVRRLSLVEGRPEYLRFFSWTYRLGWLYERIVNSTRALSGLRVVMIAVLEKPATEARP